MRRAVVLIILLVAALGLGFAAGAGVLVALKFILPPFNDDIDEDTFRNFFPPALAYLTWAVTSLLVFVVGWWKLPEDI